MEKNAVHINKGIQRIHRLLEKLEDANDNDNSPKVDHYVYLLKHAVGAMSSETYLQTLLNKEGS